MTKDMYCVSIASLMRKKMEQDLNDNKGVWMDLLK